MARYLISVHTDSERTPLTPAEQEKAWADCGTFNEKMTEAGAFVFAAGLVPFDEAEVIDATGGELVTRSGTYIDGSKRLGGFWILEAPDDDIARAYAIEAAKACNEPVELRRFR